MVWGVWILTKRTSPQPKKNRILSGNVIYSLYEDKAGNIWVGTLEGLICIK